VVLDDHAYEQSKQKMEPVETNIREDGHGVSECSMIVFGFFTDIQQRLVLDNPKQKIVIDHKDLIPKNEKGVSNHHDGSMIIIFDFQVVTDIQHRS
jgi:hypothetical protein